MLVSAIFSAQIRSTQLDISKLLLGKNADVSISVLGFEKEYHFDKNSDAKLPMLSVYKFHIAATVLQAVDEGKIRLDEKIFVAKQELLPETWSPLREQFPEGDVEISLSDLIFFTVAKSDNNASDILLKLVGGAGAVQNFFDVNGTKDFQIKTSEAEMHTDVKNIYENLTSTKSLVTVLKKFYEGKLLSKSSTDFLLKVMYATETGKDKLKAQLPAGTPIAHKTGASGTDKDGFTIADHDAGIITLPNGTHYAIAVFITRSSETEVENRKIIADISKVFYDILK